MITSSLSFCLLGLLTVASAISLRATGDEVKRGNDYVDKIIKEITDENGDKYDPYEMEEISVGFHKKVLFVNVSGGVKFVAGKLTGLKSLHRTGDCSLVKHGNKLTVTADLGAGVLDIAAEGSAKFMDIGPKVGLSSTIQYVEISMVFSVDADTGKNAILGDFRVDDMRGIKVQLTGFKLISWAINPVISGVTKVFKGIVRHVIEKIIERYVRTKIGEHEFPVEGDDQQPGGDDDNQPGGDDDNQPGGDDGNQPGGDDDNQPGGDDDNQPGGDDDNQPGGNDDNQPGGDDDNQPGGDDDNQPGGDDDNQPGGDDDNQPGGDDDNQPGVDDDNQPGGDDDNQPGGDDNQPGGDDDNETGGEDYQQPGGQDDQ